MANERASENESTMMNGVERLNTALETYLDENTDNLAKNTNFGYIEDLTAFPKYNRGTISDGQQIGGFKFRGDNWQHALGSDFLNKQIQKGFQVGPGSVSLIHKYLPAGKYFIAAEMMNALVEDTKYNLSYDLESNVFGFIGSDTIQLGTIKGEEFTTLYFIGELQRGQVFDAGFYWDAPQTGASFRIKNFQVRAFGDVTSQAQHNAAWDAFKAQWDATVSARDKVNALSVDPNYPWGKAALLEKKNGLDVYFLDQYKKHWITPDGQDAGIATTEELDDWAVYQGMPEVIYLDSITGDLISNREEYPLVRGYQQASNEIISLNKPFSDLCDAIENARQTRNQGKNATGDRETFKAEIESALSTLYKYRECTSDKTRDEDLNVVEETTQALARAKEAFLNSCVNSDIVDIDFSNGAEYIEETGEQSAQYVVRGKAGEMYFSNFQPDNQANDLGYNLGYGDEYTDMLRVGNGTATVDFEEVSEGDVVTVSFDMYYGQLQNRVVAFQLQNAAGERVAGMSYNVNSSWAIINDFNELGIDCSKIARAGSKPNTDNHTILTGAGVTSYEIVFDYGKGRITTTMNSVKNGVFVTDTIINPNSLENNKIAKFVLSSTFNNAARRCWFDNLKITRSVSTSDFEEDILTNTYLDVPEYKEALDSIDLTPIIAEADSMANQHMWIELKNQLKDVADTYRNETDNDKKYEGYAILKDLIDKSYGSIKMYMEAESQMNQLSGMFVDNGMRDTAVIAEAQQFYLEQTTALTNETLDTETLVYEVLSQADYYIRLLNQQSLTINVQEPGTLSSLVYDRVSDLSTVSGLIVSGSLNDDDIYFIAQNLTSLLKLDMGEATLSNPNWNVQCRAYSLQTLILPKNLETIASKYFFEDLSALTNIVFPSTLKSIGSGTFMRCSSLKKVVLPEGLTTLNSNAFAYCKSLTEVVLPSTLTSVSSPFYGCNNLTSITFNAVEAPYIKRYVMDGSSESNCTLYVPAELYEDFLNAEYWNLFDIQPMGSANMGNLRVTNEKWINTNDTIYQNTIPAINVTMRDRGDNYWTMDRYQYGALYTEGESMLSASQFSMYFDPYMKLQQQWNGYQGVRTSAVLMNNAPMRADSVSATLRLPANRWSFLSLPFDVKVSEIIWKNEGQPFVIYKYDGKRRADGDMNNTWVRMTADSTLHAGIGYIWQTADDLMTGYDYTTCTVTALNNTNKNNIFVRENVDVQLTEYLSELPQNRSWNLVGNPYPAYYETRAMDYTSPFITWNIAEQNYQAYSPVDDDYILMPGEAIFFQRPVDQAAITFLKEGRQVADWQNWNYYFHGNNNDSIFGARQSDMRAERSVFNLTVTGNEMSDRTRFVINNDARLSYEMDKDASKFAGMNAKGVQLYTVEQGVRMAINERPISNGEVRLGMTIGTKGTYSLKVETKVDNEVYVLDRLTGVETLLGEEGYTFETETGTQDNRFVVRLGAGELTGIKSIENSEFRMENGEIYDLSGRKVKSQLSTLKSQIRSGLYINANGKKVVVK